MHANLQKLLSESKQELANAQQLYEQKHLEYAESEKVIQELKNENQRLSDELVVLTNHKHELETRSISRQDYDELQIQLHTIEGCYFCPLNLFK